MTPLRRGRVSAALFAMAASAAFAAPASAAPATVTVADDAFGPAAVTINAGESVTWDFKESSHNAYSDDGWSVNKNFGTGTFSKTFDAAGTYAYYCQAHPDMKGTVKVDAAPAAAPAAPAAPATGQASSTAGATAAAPAAWTAPLARDTAVPRVSAVRAARSRLSLRLSEDATVVVSIRRAGRQVRRMRVKGTRGANRIALRGLKKGRYSVRVVAVDAAGNESTARASRVRISR